MGLPMQTHLILYKERSHVNVKRAAVEQTG